MQINNPLFIIPKSNNRFEQKPGGKDKPPYLGEKARFEQHKRERVSEIDTLLKYSRNVKPVISNPDDLTFFEVQLHEKALSKSAQPTALLDIGHIDIYGQKNENTFYASSSESNILSFRDTISKYTLQGNLTGSSYLSAISAIKPISKEEKIIDINLKNKAPVKAFLFFHTVIPEKSCKEIYKNLQEKYKTTSEFFVSASGSKTIYGSFPTSFLDEISESHPKNPFQRIEHSIEFIIPQSLSIKHPLDNVKVIKPDSNAIVGVVDSGIEQHSIYKDLITHVEDYIKNPHKEDFSHGTFVGSRIFFGNDIEEQIHSSKSLFANSRILDIRVMRKENGRMIIGDKELVDAIKDVLKKYSDKVKVYNLSLNNDDYKCTHSQLRHFISRELDALAYKYKVIFVISAGNQNNYKRVAYPDHLLLDESVVTPPADLINGVVVGSIADTDSSRSLALNNEPSPFSRSGLEGTRKPDLVHFGGNLDKFYRPDGIGVKGFSIQKDTIEEGVGTSYSAPLVSQILARIYAYLETVKHWQKVPVELARSLLLHSAQYNLPSNSKINEKDLGRLVGFGIPDFGRALDCAESSATFIYNDTLGTTQKKGEEVIRANKHKIQFVVPKELEGKNKRVKVRGTLVYIPQTSAMASLDYSLVDIEINLHYLNSKGTRIGGKLTENNTDYRAKWNPVKHFEKIYTSYSGGSWEIWLTLNARGLADRKDYLQDYALVISIEDVTLDITKRINLHEIVKVKHPEYIQVKPTVRLQSPV